MSLPKLNFRPLTFFKTRYTGHPLRLCVAALKTIFFCHVFNEYAFNISPAGGPSMLPTFEVQGDWLFISRLHRRGKNIHVGDVVSFDSVVEPGEKVIKRVVGMPGDYVLQHSPETTDTMIQVPRGHCWVIGDNLGYSRDSRHFGPMPLALIKGKVIAKVLPWKERKWLENPVQPIEPLN